MCDQKGNLNGRINPDNLYLAHQTMSGENASNAITIATENDNEVDRAIENIKFDFPSYSDVTDGDKSELDTNKNNTTLEEGLYDGNIAEIYLGNGVGSVERLKSSEISDSNLSEMTNSFGTIEENDSEYKTNNFSPAFSAIVNEEQVSAGNKNTLPNTENTPGTLNSSSNTVETRKRPLSPNDYANNSSDNKRVKSEPGTYVDHTDERNGTRNNTDEDVIDLCPPVAVVAPLGFCEDILDDASSENKNLKSDPNSVKNDISSILDSFDDDDGKSLSMFDSVFEKMKTDIMEGQSFKTLDDGKWTFDDKSLNGKSANVSDVTKGDNSNNNNEKQSVLKIEKEVCSKTIELKRANSVEHDIKDFEKVLSSVIANASKYSKGNESIVQKFNNTQQTSGIKPSVHSKQCKQPCNHVANSDLLRELLDQKTDTNDAQTKTRQEIDLSFLHSDLISGKGLSVSSDKILQTRSIDPRVTSMPHVDRGSSTMYPKPGQDPRGPAQPTGNKLQEGDHISLAEQRRASVTLHHKVPSRDMHLNHQSNMFNDANGDSSNIIKEAFDFATEISDLTKSESKPPNPMPIDPRQQMLSCGNNPNMQNEHFLNRNNYNQSLKIDPMQNNQMLRTSRMQQEMHPGSGLLTFASQGGAQTSDSSLPPQLAGPFMNSTENSTGRIPDIRQQQDPNQRPPFYSKKVDMPSFGSRPNSGNGEMQPYKPQFDPTQTNKMMYANSMQQFPSNQIDHLHNQKQNQPYANQNIPAGYPSQGASHVNPVSRNNMPDIGLPSQEKVPNYRQDPGMPMHYMNRGAMMPPENNYSMGMQERIRAMNVQQWYRRRVQAQMNKQMPQQSMMMPQQVMSQGQGMGMHPSSHGVRMRQRQMYQGLEPGDPMMHQDQNMEHRLRAMQTQAGAMNAANAADSQRSQHFPQGQNQMNFESQNLRQQMQFGQQMNQQNKMADAEAVNSMYSMSRPFPTNGMVDKGNVTAPIGELSQQFDIKRESFNAQSVQDMFPF